MTTTLYVVRHGQTVDNANGVNSGWSDTTLTDKGKGDAVFLAENLNGITFDTIYASDLKRAFMTASLILTNLGIKKDVVKRKELREIDYGDYTLLKKSKMAEICPKFKVDVKYVMPNGESFSQLYDRIALFLKEISVVDQTILIACHSGTVRAIRCYFKNLPFEEHLKDKIPHKRVYKFVLEDGKCIEHEEF
jgi:alpha-ribazole phosphatase